MDKRLIKTKEVLKTALGELMLEKDISKITIKELTQKSGINRGTFYLHYKDIDELLYEVENDLISNFINIEVPNVPLDTYSIILYRLMKMLEYVKKEKLLFRVLTSHHGDIVFLQKIRQTLLDEFMSPFIATNEYNEDSLKYFFNFIISGAIGSVQEWLRTDCVIPYDVVINPCELIIREAGANLHKLKKNYNQ